MEPITAWSLLVGVVFLMAGFAKGPLKNLPIAMPPIYLLIGLAISKWGFGLIDINLIDDAKLVEVLTEIAVLVSLLTAGLKLAPSLTRLKETSVPLAGITMCFTIAAVAVMAYFFLNLPVGAAILLGAVLAPTDPVLAAEVQVDSHEDRDKLRYALTGEAGLNDGAAFPFIMLGLGLLGLHDLGDFAWRWIVIDLIWATVAGIGIGWLCGYTFSQITVAIKKRDDVPAVCEELLTLGLIGVSYGTAMAIQSYGFLAVFAAGVAVRRFAETEDEGQDQSQQADNLMLSVTKINELFGEIIEVALVVLIGALLASHFTLADDWWIAVVLFAVIRPMGTWMALGRTDTCRIQKLLISFFGIRGIGSVYYLSYAIGYGLDPEIARRLSEVTLTVIALSLLLHSNLASTLLQYYRSSK